MSQGLMHKSHYCWYIMEPFIKEYHDWLERMQKAASQCGLPLIYDRGSGMPDLLESLRELEYDPKGIMLYPQELIDEVLNSK